MAQYHAELDDDPENLELMRRAMFALEGGLGSFADVALVLGREWRLPRPFWTEFAGAVRARGADLSARAVFEDLAAVCKAWTLRGPLLERTPRVFGRLLEVNQAIALVREAGFDFSSAEEWLWSLTCAQVETVRRVAGWLPIGRYAVWSTFSPLAEAGANPFEPCPDIHMLPVELGLELDVRTPSSRKYLMLAYELPSGVLPRSATAADAYASGVPNARYRPFGWTHPTIADQPDAVLRPECIHDVVRMDCLAAPIGGIPAPGWHL